jgi:two-component system cell cycle sensor histidine kinase/response regulator CckA
MITFEKLGIASKLKIIIMLTCTTVILISSLSSMILTYLNYRQGLVNDLHGLADTVGHNSSVAMKFGIPEDAEKALSVLESRKSIVYASLYDATDQWFAAYPAGAKQISPTPFPLESARHWFDRDSLNLVHPVVVKGERIGTIILKDDLSGIAEPIRRTILMNVVVMLVALVVAYLLASRLQKLITHPVLSLARTAEQVSRQKDFSIRAIKENDDEVGTLIDSFNEMLAQIQQGAEVLRKSEERFRAVIEKAPLAIGIARNLQVIYTNPKFADLFGFDDPAEINGQSIFDRVAPHEVEKFRERIQRRELGLPMENTFESSGLRKDGSTFDVLASTTSVELADGPAIIGFFHDISESKRAEQQRIQLEAQLRQAQKMESIGTLAGGIAHDFNNILGALSGYAELALMEKHPPDDPTRQYLEQILKAANRARDLVRQILIFSRQSEQELKPVHVNVLVEEALKLLRASIPTSIEIRWEIPSKTMLIMADPTQIHQVLMNLCTNAAHAMGNFNGELFVSLTEEIVDHASTSNWEGIEPGYYSKITVRDTGKGMEGEIRKRVFEPFFTTKPPGQGTGLGLSVVHGIVKNHHGAIRVNSKVDVGTTFEVVFPLLQMELTAGGSPQALALPRGNGEQILIVDDEADIAHIVASILKRLGYNPRTETSSLAALAEFRNRPDSFRLLITDQTMPDLTGLELSLEFLKIRPGFPIIICTGFSERISESNIRAHGITKYLLKPITFASLAESVAQALANSPLNLG